MNIKKIKFVFIFLALSLFLSSCGVSQKYTSQQLFSYAKENKEFFLKDVWDFSWDIVYIDTRPYESGNYIAEKYALEFEVDIIATEEIYRLLFFKENKLVAEIRYEMLYINFPENVEYLHPDTNLASSWNSNGDILFLSLAN